VTEPEVWLFLDNERERAALLARDRVLVVLTHLGGSRG
jgi:hypothetical protein